MGSVTACPKDIRLFARARIGRVFVVPENLVFLRTTYFRDFLTGQCSSLLVLSGVVRRRSSGGYGNDFHSAGIDATRPELIVKMTPGEALGDAWVASTMKKHNNKNSRREELSRPVTMDSLGHFTEQVILPGVERIVGEEVGALRDEVEGLRDEMRGGFDEMRSGFKDINTAIKSLAGEVVEIKVTMEDQKYEPRLRRMEEKLGLRGRA